MKKKIILNFFLVATIFAFSQDEIKYKIHSHNDYLKNIPFWDAYSAGASSIEVDLFYKNHELYATHEENNIIKNRTFESLYLEPLQKAYSLGLGKTQKLVLLIDIKSEAYSSLNAIIDTLKKYPYLIKNKIIKFVISGNRPKVIDYPNYPDFIYFDYQSLETNLSQEQKDKIALVSLNFQNYLKWDGNQEMTTSEYLKIEVIIDQADELNKDFRFWGIPDTRLSWNTFSKLGVDFINTDKTYECVNFLSSKD